MCSQLVEQHFSFVFPTHGGSRTTLQIFMMCRIHLRYTHAVGYDLKSWILCVYSYTETATEMNYKLGLFCDT